MLKVVELVNPATWEKIPNQFVIYFDNLIFLRSFGKIVARIDKTPDENGTYPIVLLDEWNQDKETAKAVAKFIACHFQGKWGKKRIEDAISFGYISITPKIELS